MKLQALRAKHGDSILLFGNATVLIDGGPSGVYNQRLKNRLKSLEGNGVDAPVIDLLMVSHIDADHIDGLLDLTAELIEAQQERSTPIVNITRAWHNSFSDVITGSATETSTRAASVASAFGNLIPGGLDPRDSQSVLASVAQGRRLRDDLGTLSIDLNPRFPESLVLPGSAGAVLEIGDMTLTVIGPTKDEVDDLRVKWERELPAILEGEAAAATAAAASLDKSVSNLASIVVIAEEDGKSALLTGDARGDMILEWMEASGRIQPGGSVHFDILKLPHHGSDRNVNPEFFQRITADHYVVSGDGKHGNPEPEMFKMLFEARPDLDYTIHMTYGLDEIKTHPEFIEDGKVAELDEVFAGDGREAIVNSPGDGEDSIEIEL